ncbi:MAG: DNA recombination protein RmuC [Stellaceae bacterium]
MLFAVSAVLAIAATTFGFLFFTMRQKLAESAARLGQTESRANAATESRIAAERAAAAAEARVGDLERVLGEADAARLALVDAAKAATLEAAQQLSSKLIDDHRRETAEAKTDAETRVRAASDSLVTQVSEIAKAVHQINADLAAKGRALDTLWRSLSSPGGAGQLAEIGLANTLKGFGLEDGRDYRLQATTSDEVTGRRLRPDALVFLPGSAALVIDCKASKYLLEIAAAEDADDEAEAYANLARTMNQHLKALADKDYRSAVLADWRTAGRLGELQSVHSIMYLPSEAALERLARADASFFARARAAAIIPAGPAGLYCALQLAAAEITKERQAENQQRIIESAQRLVDAISVVLGYAAKVGKGIRDAAANYDEFGRSVNGRLLPRARQLIALGVPSGKALPAALPAFTVMSQEAEHLIDGDATELAEPLPARLAARRLAD